MNWVDIKEYEGLYQINESGEVRSLRRAVKCANGTRTIPERLIKPFKDKNGCIKFQLFKNNKRRTLSINTLKKSLVVGS